ncbi:MAG: BppU family phage baseplate upper protein [Coriobacteriia bacterium]|nr:BppU family phage baseplate upper protein [Coriobacteriia bacterium]
MDFRVIEITIDTQGNFYPEDIILKQGDINGREFWVNLTDYGAKKDLTGLNAQVAYKRPDNVSDIFPLTLVDGHFQGIIPPKANEVAGDVVFTVQILDGDRTTETVNIVARCEGSPASIQDIKESESFKDFIGLPDQANIILNNASQILSNAEAEFEAAEHQRQADFDAQVKSCNTKCNNLAAQMQQEHTSAQTARQSDYDSWKLGIGADAESRIQAKEKLFDNSLANKSASWDSAQNERESAFDQLNTQAQGAINTFNTNSAAALNKSKQDYAGAVAAKEQEFDTAIGAKESSADAFIEELQDRITQLDEGIPLTKADADASYAPLEGNATQEYVRTRVTNLFNWVDGELKGKQPKGTYVTSVNGIEGTAITIPDASISASGLMSATDKGKLNGIETGAQKNTVTSVNGLTGAVTVPLPNVATQASAGLISAADKKKLDGIQAGAQVNTVTSVNGMTGAVTISPPDLTPYATKTAVAADKQALQSQINTKVTGTGISSIKVVSALPTTGQANTLYLVLEG